MIRTDPSPRQAIPSLQRLEVGSRRNACRGTLVGDSGPNPRGETNETNLEGLGIGQSLGIGHGPMVYGLLQA